MVVECHHVACMCGDCMKILNKKQKKKLGGGGGGGRRLFFINWEKVT